MLHLLIRSTCSGSNFIIIDMLIDIFLSFSSFYENSTLIFLEANCACVGGGKKHDRSTDNVFWTPSQGRTVKPSWLEGGKKMTATYHCVIHICTCTIAGFTFIHVPLCDSHWYMYHCRIHIYTCILQGSHLYMYTVGFTFIHVPLQDSHLYMYHCRIHIFIHVPL